MTVTELVLAYLFLGALMMWRVEASDSSSKHSPAANMILFLSWPLILLAAFAMTASDVWEWLTTEK